MAKRYDNTEKLGIIYSQSIIIKEFGWIFREQPISDFGVDAHLELVDNFNPSCILAGLQIKSGISHFYESDDKLTYYASNTHYDYWTKSNIPLFFIAFIPEHEKAYWQQIVIDNFEKTEKQWKIEIPKNQIFDKSSKEAIEEAIRMSNKDIDFLNILLSKPSKEISILEHAQLSKETFKEAKEVIENTGLLMSNYNNELKESNIKTKDFIKEGMAPNSSRGKRHLESIATKMTKFAKRLDFELDVLDNLFEVGMQSYFSTTIKFLEFIPDNDFSTKFTLEIIDSMQKELEKSVIVFDKLKISVENFKYKGMPSNLRKANNKAIKAVNKILQVCSVQLQRTNEMKNIVTKEII